jgi:sugar transferase (PEP-CTERM system associated)
MLKLFSRYVPLKTVLLLVTENVLITGTLAALLQWWARSLFQDADVGSVALRVAFITLVFQVSLFYNDLYDLTVVHTRSELLIRTLQSFGAAGVLLSILFYIFPSLIIGEGNYVVVLFLVIGVLFLLGWRTLVGYAARFYETPRRVLVVGTGDVAVDLVKALRDRPDLNMKVMGFLGESAEQVGSVLVNPKVVGVTEQLEELVESHNIDRVVVALPDRRNRLPVRALLNLKLRGVVIEDAHTLFENVTGKIRTTALPPSWLVFSEGFSALDRKVRLKQAFDFLLALVAAAVALPAGLVIAILVKLDSKGPALFRQERVGYRGKVFRVAKFRTMREDAEAQAGPQWATEDDPRITRLGRFLRKSRLDELPQIWNILHGDMSWVGPRPERPHFVQLLTEQLNYYAERHSVRPGLTGWAQIRYHYGSSVEDALEKLQYDLFYIKNLSLALDLAILFETGKIVLFGRGR